MILSNLNQNRDPFYEAKSPVDNKPEKRKSLPIKDSTN
jgi:hypothetical protein